MYCLPVASVHLLCHEVDVSSIVPPTAPPLPCAVTLVMVPSLTVTVMPLDGLAAREPLFGVILTLAAESGGLGLGLGLAAGSPEPETEEVEQPLAMNTRTTPTARVTATQRQLRTTAVEARPRVSRHVALRLVLIALP